MEYACECDSHIIFTYTILILDIYIYIYIYIKDILVHTQFIRDIVCDLKKEYVSETRNRNGITIHIRRRL